MTWLTSQKQCQHRSQERKSLHNLTPQLAMIPSDPPSTTPRLSFSITGLRSKISTWANTSAKCLNRQTKSETTYHLAKTLAQLTMIASERFQQSSLTQLALQVTSFPKYPTAKTSKSFTKTTQGLANTCPVTNQSKPLHSMVQLWVVVINKSTRVLSWVPLTESTSGRMRSTLPTQSRLSQ